MFRVALIFMTILVTTAPAAERASSGGPSTIVEVNDPAWRDWFAQFERRPSTGLSDFEERRWFTFRKTPTVLHGEARVSAEHGISLHYPGKKERTVIVDDRGMLVREGGRDTVPSDARAAAANTALLHLLRFDFASLAETFEVRGERDGAAWKLALLPRTEAVRRTLGRITVAGEGVMVRRIELRRSPTQRVEILIEPPRAQGGPFTAEELRRFFR